MTQSNQRIKYIGLFVMGALAGAGLLAAGLGITSEYERQISYRKDHGRAVEHGRQVLRIRDEMEDSRGGPLPNTRRLVHICKKAGFIRQDDDVFETENYFLAHRVFGIAPAGGRPELMIIHVDPSLEEATLVFSTGDVVSLPLRGSRKELTPHGRLPW